jgi:hypothetical protein
MAMAVDLALTCVKQRPEEALLRMSAGAVDMDE